MKLNIAVSLNRQFLSFNNEGKLAVEEAACSEFSAWICINKIHQVTESKARKYLFNENIQYVLTVMIICPCYALPALLTCNAVKT